MINAKNCRGLAIALLLLPLTACAQVTQTVDRVCTYQPTPDGESVLGKDAQFMVKEDGDRTIFSYQELPSVPVAENIQLQAKRELIFANTQLDTARVILLQNPQYFTQLVGKETEPGFAAVNESLKCE